eukprot:11391829-Alexandrium_andersonii.AAC.1
MSASLVGSEMCIRDRTSPVPCLRPERPPVRCAHRWRRSFPHPRPRPWPVSYTHLTLPTICSV